MLNLLRKKKIMKRILWFLAAVIIPAFVLWGAGSMSKRDFPYKYVGTVEGKKISIEDFVKSVQHSRVNLFLNYFSQPQTLRRFQNDRTFLNRLAWDNIIMQEKAKKSKISVSDEEVIGFVTGHPLFSRGGEFNDELYRYILRNSLGIMPRTFEESVRLALLNAKYKDEILKDVTVSDEELKETYKGDVEKAKLYYVVIDKTDFRDDALISEEEITEYYEKRKADFKEPEKALLQYIAFPHGGTTKADTLEELNGFYEKFKENPSDIESIAADLDLILNETSPFARNDLVREIASTKDVAAISFGMTPESEVITLTEENDSGFSYILRVKEKIPSRIKTKDEVSSIIVDRLKGEKSLELAKEKAEGIYQLGENEGLSLKNRLKKQKKLDRKKRRRARRRDKKKSEKKSFDVSETEPVSRSDYIEGIGEGRVLVNKAFEMKPGEVSRPIQIRKGFALIEPIEFEYMDEETFEEVKETYKNKALSQKNMQFFSEWFERAKKGTSLTVDLDKL